MRHTWQVQRCLASVDADTVFKLVEKADVTGEWDNVSASGAVSHILSDLLDAGLSLEALLHAQLSDASHVKEALGRGAVSAVELNMVVAVCAQRLCGLAQST